jgi:hypothetical protein
MHALEEPVGEYLVSKRLGKSKKYLSILDSYIRHGFFNRTTLGTLIGSSVLKVTDSPQPLGVYNLRQGLLCQRIKMKLSKEKLKSNIKIILFRSEKYTFHQQRYNLTCYLILQTHISRNPTG